MDSMGKTESTWWNFPFFWMVDLDLQGLDSNEGTLRIQVCPKKGITPTFLF